MSWSLVGNEVSVLSDPPETSKIAIFILLNSLTFKSTNSFRRKSKLKMSQSTFILFGRR
jgi:hypothetical protein